MTDGCVFCRIIAGTESAHIARRFPDAIAIAPLNPVTPGHLLVIPHKHVADARDAVGIGIAAYWASQLMTSLGGDWNLITSIGPAATQTIRHLHVHLVPRTPGDGLMLPWGRQGETQRKALT